MIDEFGLFTLALRLTKMMSMAAVAKLFSEHSNNLWGILDHYVERARQAVDQSGLRLL